jgi:hypothetical protein
METDREKLPLWREILEEERQILVTETCQILDEEARQMERQKQIPVEEVKITRQNSARFVRRTSEFNGDAPP